ncbi:hypothetical protein QN277_007872 [Acacia crassicarpa]|uniref:Uncharacterized protein n=1 Tax=Acacia crassicarpa TaxID=499986 RepID=A0AAE1IXX4_9FABA|nr:hypothetical protein QN277_007872 [Acacia crassicarpa]
MLSCPVSSPRCCFVSLPHASKANPNQTRSNPSLSIHYSVLQIDLSPLCKNEPQREREGRGTKALCRHMLLFLVTLFALRIQL